MFSKKKVVAVDQTVVARIEKAKDYLKMFQKRLILNAASSPLYKTKLSDSSKTGVYDFSHLISPDPQNPSLLQCLLFSEGAQICYDPKTFHDQ
jgi:hypothetical protein